MAAIVALVWMSPATQGWSPLAFAFIVGICGGCEYPGEAASCVAGAVGEAGLSTGGHVGISRIGNTEYSQRSHRHLFEQLRNAQESVTRPRPKVASGTPVCPDKGPDAPRACAKEDCVAHATAHRRCDIP